MMEEGDLLGGIMHVVEIFKKGVGDGEWEVWGKREGLYGKRGVRVMW